MRALPDPTARGLITGSTMLAAVLVTLDSTIANVALPHIQSSIAASPEQIVWVITSYVIAGAIATPLSGWLATRFGRKEVMVVSVAGFYAETTRPNRATVKAVDRQGRPFRVTGRGFLARALQHELDHLDGRLYVDHLESLDLLQRVGADGELEPV